jgi:hypothetical protein
MSTRELRREVQRCRQRIDELEEIQKLWIQDQKVKAAFEAGC